MADLSKFGVPTKDKERNGILHPKQSYRFRVIFHDFGVSSKTREVTQGVESCTRPVAKFDPVEVHAYNSISKIASKPMWDDVTLVIKDTIDNSIVSEVGAQIQKQFNFYEQTSAVAGANYKFRMDIESLDGTNNGAIEIWRLDGCYISNAKYPDGDYKSSDISLVELTITYDVATHIAGENDNGGTILMDDPFLDIPVGTGQVRSN